MRCLAPGASQDGHALDILPNVAPNQLATYVAECMPNMVTSLEVCKDELLADGTLTLGGNSSANQGFDAEDLYDDDFFKVRTSACLDGNFLGKVCCSAWCALDL